ncbi:hypothetical protein ACLMJK_009724, partial [Lecanora helva]
GNQRPGPGGNPGPGPGGGPNHVPTSSSSSSRSDEDDEAAGSDTDYPDTESPEVQYRRDLEYVLRSETLRVPQPTASKSLPPLKSLNLPDSRQVPQTNTEQRDPTAMIQVD